VAVNFPTARTLLLVEDEPALQRIVGGVLADAGHHVAVAGNVEEALARVRTGGRVDLIVTDKNLPGHDGLALLAALRADEREGNVEHRTAVVMTTGYPSRDSALQALAHDADGYLVKPFVSLPRAVERILSVLDADPVARRLGPPRARRVADALAGLPVALDDTGVGVVAGALTTTVERMLRSAGARLLPAISAERADVVVAGTIADVRAVAGRRKGPAFVLLDAGASFKEIVELIECGGGAVVDPVLLEIDG
jgi:CheY-like chemotaxis protein